MNTTPLEKNQNPEWLHYIIIIKTTNIIQCWQLLYHLTEKYGYFFENIRNILQDRLISIKINVKTLNKIKNQAKHVIRQKGSLLDKAFDKI